MSKTYCVDTNYLLRFLTKDIIEQYGKAEELLLNDKNSSYIPVVVLAETNYILQNYYEIGKEAVVASLKDLLGVKNVRSERFAAKALDMYAESGVSFYDALIAAESLDKGYELKTFDKKLENLYKAGSLA